MSQQMPARQSANSPNVPVRFSVAAPRSRAVRIAASGALALCLIAGNPALAATACCEVTDIAANGQVTAREIDGTRTLRFQVADAAMLRRLKPGAPVYANFDTRQVSLDGRKPCCRILQVATAAAPAAPKTIPAAPEAPPAPQPAPAAPAANTQAFTPGGCPPGVFAWWRDHGRGGRIVCASDPTRPAVLLFHGLHQDAHTWTAPSHVQYAYNYGSEPGRKRVGDTHSAPNAGVYKAGASAWLYGDDRDAWNESVNWFDHLVSRGFTVATWSQPGLSFADAFPSAREAFDSLLAQTAARSPSAPPPVVLLGHSRGGLLIRKVLKDRGSAGGRVQAVVTLHSPHKGSELGRAPGRIVAEVVDLVDCCIPGELTAPVKNDVKDAVTEVMRPFTKIFSAYENRELTPDGPLMRELAQGEQAVPGVRYYTYGGTNPTYYKMYLWTFDAKSAVPQYRDLTQYFVWRVTPVEIGPLSPIMDELRDFVDEVKPGKGDGLVTDASARLPWSQHTTTRLNHAEVLWNRPLQQQVAAIIADIGGAAPLRPGARR